MPIFLKRKFKNIFLSYFSYASILKKIFITQSTKNLQCVSEATTSMDCCCLQRRSSRRKPLVLLRYSTVLSRFYTTAESHSHFFVLFCYLQYVCGIMKVLFVSFFPHRRYFYLAAMFSWFFVTFEKNQEKALLMVPMLSDRVSV